MKRIILAAFSTVAFFSTADDLPTAPPELIAELKQYCSEVAEDDGTDGMPLNEFILKCVNDELESEGYKRITSLD